MTVTSLPDYFTAQELAAEIGVNEGSVRRAYRKGLIPGHLVDGRLIFVRSELVRSLKSPIQES